MCACCCAVCHTQHACPQTHKFMSTETAAAHLGSCLREVCQNKYTHISPLFTVNPIPREISGQVFALHVAAFRQSYLTPGSQWLSVCPSRDGLPSRHPPPPSGIPAPHHPEKRSDPNRAKPASSRLDQSHLQHDPGCGTAGEGAEGTGAVVLGPARPHHCGAVPPTDGHRHPQGGLCMSCFLFIFPPLQRALQRGTP